MSLGNKLYDLRKKKGLSQEEAGDKLNVTRQTISKWEMDQSIPEIDKLKSISKLYEISIDVLLDNEVVSTEKENGMPYYYGPRSYEYKSKASIFGIPLVHINIGRGKRTAKGIVAIGNIAFGLFSLGFISIGLISFGLLAIGLIALGVLGIGGLALGALAIGIIAMGAIGIGYLAMGAVAIGAYSIGAIAIASNVAIGYYANAHIAIGNVPHGNFEVLRTSQGLVDMEFKAVKLLITEEFPNAMNWIKDFLFLVLR